MPYAVVFFEISLLMISMQKIVWTFLICVQVAATAHAQDRASAKETGITRAREAIRAGRLDDAEALLRDDGERDYGRGSGFKRVGELMPMFALELADLGELELARDCASRGWRAEPLTKSRANKHEADRSARRWRTAGVVQWRVFGDLSQAQVALQNAVEVSDSSDSEAVYLLGHLAQIQIEAAAKADANKRGSIK